MCSIVSAPGGQVNNLSSTQNIQSIIFKNKKKVKMFEDIIKMLSRESEEYQKLLEYDKQRTAGL